MELVETVAQEAQVKPVAALVLRVRLPLAAMLLPIPEAEAEAVGLYLLETLFLPMAATAAQAS